MDAAATAAAEQQCEHRVDHFFVTYPDGLLHACEQELLSLGGDWVEHWKEQCAALISLRHDDAGRLPGTFSLIFRTFAGGGTRCSSVITDRTLSAGTLDALTSALVSANAAAIQEYLGREDRWRITATRLDLSTYTCTHDFNSQQVERSVGEALQQCFRPQDLPPVSLSNYVNELCVWVGENILALGFMSPRCGARDLHQEKTKGGGGLSVEKGTVVSRADDAVSVCMAWIGLSHALALSGPVLDRSPGLASAQEPGRKVCAGIPGEGILQVLDPMCGVGTYLFGAATVADTLGIDVMLHGCDVSSESIEMACVNAQVLNSPPGSSLLPGTRRGGADRFDFRVSDCVEEAPCADGWAHLILVDPPWGQRHSSYNVVKKATPKWARRWATALCDGGVLVVVTIRTKSFEHDTVPMLAALGVTLRDVVRFNNKGFYMCKYFVFIKQGGGESPLTSQGQDSGTPIDAERQRASYRQERKAMSQALLGRRQLQPGEPVSLTVVVSCQHAKRVLQSPCFLCLLIATTPMHSSGPQAEFFECTGAHSRADA